MADENSKHIVVVGGGIIGCSTAYHLLRQGVKKVTLVEAGEPGSATTSAGAGFVSHWSAGMIPLGEEGFQLQQYGLDFYHMLHELGTEIGYRPNDLAQSLHRTRSMTVGIISSDSFGRFTFPIVEALE